MSRSGDYATTVLPLKLRTVFDITLPPPATARVGDVVNFAGILKDETGAIVDFLPRPIELYRNGVRVAYTATALGLWVFGDIFKGLPAGTYTHYVSFPGDDYYEGCEEEVGQMTTEIGAGGGSSPLVPIALVGLTLLGIGLIARRRGS